MSTKFFVTSRIVVLIVLGAATSGWGFGASYRMTSSLYGWESACDDSLEQSHWRGSQAVAFTLSDLVVEDLSLHGYVLGSHDFGTETSGDPRFDVRNSYLAWGGRRRPIELKVGRQPVFRGAGGGFIDGADIALRVGRQLRLFLFAGALVHKREVPSSDTWHKGRLVGGGVQGTDPWGGQIGVCYTERTTRSAEAGIGRFSGTSVSGARYREQSVTVDAVRRLGGRFYGSLRLEADPFARRIQRGDVFSSYVISDRLRASGEYGYRTARLRPSSVLSVFDGAVSHRVSTRLTYQIVEDAEVGAAVGGVFFDDGTARQIDLSGRYHRFSAGYRRRFGDAGESDGVDAGLTVSVSERADARLRSHLERYRIDESAEDWSVTSLISCGLEYRPGRNWSLIVDGQGLRNSEYDWEARVLVLSSYWGTFLQ